MFGSARADDSAGAAPFDDISLHLDSPENKASFLSRITYTWLTPLMELGVERPLVITDFYLLNQDTTAKTVAENFEREWAKECARDPVSPSIVNALSAIYGGAFWSAGLLKLTGDAFQLVTPTLLGWLITFVAESQMPANIANPPAAYLGYIYAGAIFVCALIQTLAINSFFKNCMDIGLRCRTTLITALYRKSLKLTSASRQQQSTGQIVNMMSTDSSRIDLLMPYLHFLWAAALQVIVIVTLLIITLGWAAVAGLATLFVLTPMQGKIIGMSQSNRRDIVKWTDARVKLMNEILQGIKVLKVYAWEQSFLTKLGHIRDQEMQFVRHSALLRAGATSLMMLGPTIMSVVTYVVYSMLNDGTLPPQKVFQSLVYFNMLRLPLMLLPMVFSNLADSRVALERITKFLISPELDEKPYETIDDSVDGDAAIIIDDANFRWDSPADIPKTPASSRDPISPSTSTTTSQGEIKYRAVSNNEAVDEKSNKLADVAVKLEAVALEVAPLLASNMDDVVVDTLRDITVRIKRGAFTAVVGAVAAGKSSFLAGLLGEMKRTKGSVKVSGRIGYCPQQTWIQNASLRDNILFGQPFEAEKYSMVIQMCALSRDLEVLPDGDMTEIGEKGINLSDI